MKIGIDEFMEGHYEIEIWGASLDVVNKLRWLTLHSTNVAGNYTITVRGGVAVVEVVANLLGVHSLNEVLPLATTTAGLPTPKHGELISPYDVPSPPIELGAKKSQKKT